MEQDFPGARDDSLRRRAVSGPVRHTERVGERVCEGTAPASVIATGKAFTRRSRPLCADPTHAQYIGTGDSEDAQSFRCQQKELC
jgi:hypothetical protein